MNSDILKGMLVIEQTIPILCDQHHQRSHDNTIKDRRTSERMLVYANYDLTFELHVDANGIGLGALLCQKQLRWFNASH